MVSRNLSFEVLLQLKFLMLNKRQFRAMPTVQLLNLLPQQSDFRRRFGCLLTQLT